MTVAAYLTPWVRPSRGWNFRELVMVAAGAAVMPHAFGDMERVFMAVDTLSRPIALSMGVAAACWAAEIVVVAGVAYASADGVAANMRGTAASAAAGIRGFFEKAGIVAERRRVAVSPDNSFAKALTDGLTAAGSPFHAVAVGQDTLVAADANNMDRVLNQLDIISRNGRLDRTAISLLHTLDGPMAFRRLPDGSSAALWANKNGSPHKVVGFGSDGAAAWVFDPVTGGVDRDLVRLASEGTAPGTLETMRDACKHAARQHREMRSRMVEILDTRTHTLEYLDDGTIRIRNSLGKLDSPEGVPAVFRPDGSATFMLSGTIVSEEDALEMAAARKPGNSR